MWEGEGQEDLAHLATARLVLQMSLLRSHPSTRPSLTTLSPPPSPNPRFGAFFGLAASLAISRGRQRDYTSANPKNAASPVSNIFSLVGTLLLYLYWPSFNAALASVSAIDAAKPNPTGLEATLASQQFL